jgi:3-oxoacyl-[acyl-carrier-protein] synthase-3
MTVSATYINSLGAFLPGPSVSNDQMESLLGVVGGRPSKVRPMVLRQNKIKARHYALDPEGRITHRVSELAALAVKDALSRWTGSQSSIDFLVAATSQGDSLVPGFACASSLMALRTAQLALMAGGRNTAIVCAGELPSRFFRPAFLNVLKHVIDGARPDTDIEFLRWMLSDGGSAAIVENSPRARGLSLRIDWIDTISYASEYPTCMYAGARKSQEQAELDRYWYEYSSVEEAVKDGALTLRQDMRLLENIVKLGVRRYFELIDEGKIQVSEIDWMVCHYSSHHFYEQIQNLLKNTGGYIPEENWFTNLYEVGNVGSASFLLNLHDLFKSERLRPGQKILCMIPESARFTLGFAQFTVTTAELEQMAGSSRPKTPPFADVVSNEVCPSVEIKEQVLRGLVDTWSEFDAQLRTVPFIEKMGRNCLTLSDYQSLILNLRQQVVEGARWIARAASSITSEYTSIRSSFMRHAVDEHRDFELLEQDFAATGGDVIAIRNREKNVGSEALSAWMFHQASQPNPFDLLGAMFIIEGLGRNFAQTWAQSIQAQLGLASEQVRFLSYHGSNDEKHMDKFYEALSALPLTSELGKRIVKTARVTAELYVLQLRRIEGV